MDENNNYDGCLIVMMLTVITVFLGGGEQILSVKAKTRVSRH